MSLTTMKEPASKQHGFSLLEVLISLVIIMFALLGTAGMQMLALTKTETARYSSMASIMASDLGARMKGNISYWGTPPATVAIKSQSGSVVLTGGPTPSKPAPDCQSAACSATDMAYYDLQTWGTTVLNSLPNGTADLACNSHETPAICTVTISWTEKNLGVFNPTGAEKGTSGMATGTSGVHAFQTLVSIL